MVRDLDVLRDQRVELGAIEHVHRVRVMRDHLSVAAIRGDSIEYGVYSRPTGARRSVSWITCSSVRPVEARLCQLSSSRSPMQLLAAPTSSKHGNAVYPRLIYEWMIP